jgi:hypothetical protein
MAVSRHLSRSGTPKARSSPKKTKEGGKVASYGRLSLPGVGPETASELELDGQVYTYLLPTKFSYGLSRGTPSPILQ